MWLIVGVCYAYVLVYCWSNVDIFLCISDWLGVGFISVFFLRNSKFMVSICSVSVWRMFGFCLVYVWCRCGLCLVHVWLMFGSCSV